MAFVNTWMAFNGWMESVTDAPSDRAMITALADNRRVTDAYDDLMNRHADFRRRVMSFSEMWPILNVRDVRKKLGRDALWRLSRDKLREACLREDVKLEPFGWNTGDRPTWPQVLMTIYAVLCNLFHDVNSAQNLRDRDLILHFSRILLLFIDRTGCFEWYD